MLKFIYCLARAVVITALVLHDAYCVSGRTDTTVRGLCGAVTSSAGAADSHARGSALHGGDAAEGTCCASSTGYEQPPAIAVAVAAADAAHSTAEHTLDAADPQSTRSLLQSSETAFAIPASVSSGTASALFPNASFASWCASDTTCSAAVSSGSTLSLSLTHITDTAPVTSITLNWPNVFSANGVSSLTLVSGIVELQLYDSTGSYTAKQDQAICSSSGTSTATGACSAQLVVPLTSALDATKSFVCLRLEPTILGGSYQAYGYPPGSDGTTTVGIIFNNALRCNTTKFGKHIIMQYTKQVLVPPSQPVSSPPPNAPPPAPLNATGVRYDDEVTLNVTLVVGLSFDTLKADEAQLADLISSLEGSLATSLSTLVPQLLLMQEASTGSVRKISRYTQASETAVLVEFSLVVPAGCTSAQLAVLETLLASNTTAMFAGSSYTSLFLSPAVVQHARSGSSGGLSAGAVAGIAVGTMLGVLLIAGSVYGINQWRQYMAIRPQKPETADFDPRGVLVTRPSHAGARRRKMRTQAPGDAMDGAISAGGGFGGGALGAGGGGGGGAPGVEPPPWRGAHAGGAGPGGVKSEAELGAGAKAAWD